MALVLLCLCVAFGALVIVAIAGVLSREPQSVAAAAPLAMEALIEAPARPALRPALQTSAALLALAIALDVSAASQPLAAVAGPDGVYSLAAAEEPFVLGDAAQEWVPVEPAADWAFKAISTTDGWLI